MSETTEQQNCSGLIPVNQTKANRESGEWRRTGVTGGEKEIAVCGVNCNSEYFIGGVLRLFLGGGLWRLADNGNRDGCLDTERSAGFTIRLKIRDIGRSKGNRPKEQEENNKRLRKQSTH